MKLTRLSLAAAILPLVALLTTGCGPSTDPDDGVGYSTESVRWGSACDPFVPVDDATFSPSEEPCLELILGGYYSGGSLTARYFLGEQQVGESTVHFDRTGVLIQRLKRGAAESRVTFQLHGGPLPTSDQYRVVLERSGREVAQYGFRVVE